MNLHDGTSPVLKQPEWSYWMVWITCLFEGNGLYLRQEFMLHLYVNLCGALVESMTFNRRAARSTPFLDAT